MVTVNEIFLDFISNKMGISFGDALVFWIVMVIVAFGIFFILRSFTDFTKSVSFVISIIPIVIVDALVSFGSYTYELPIIGSITINNFVMTSSLIDYVFSFQLFNHGKDIMALYVQSTISSTIIIKLITGLFSIGDSILQFILFFLAFYYIFSLVEYRLNREFWWQIPASIICGFTPVLIYAFYFSNPFEEFHKANIEISSIFYFFNMANPLEVIQVIFYGFISFLIVLLAFATITRFILSASITFIPKMQEYEWRTSYISVAFLLTIMYSFLYVMHPDYKWYIIIFVIFAWKGFRSVMGGLSNNAKRKTQMRHEKQKEVDSFLMALNNKNSLQSKTIHTPRVKDDLLIEKILMGIGIILIMVVLVLFLISIGKL